MTATSHRSGQTATSPYRPDYHPTLAVTAAYLTKVNPCPFSDPYVEADYNGEKHVVPKVNRTSNPKWNRTLMYGMIFVEYWWLTFNQAVHNGHSHLPMHM